MTTAALERAPAETREAKVTLEVPEARKGRLWARGMLMAEAEIARGWALEERETHARAAA